MAIYMMRGLNFNLTSDFRNTSQAALEAQGWTSTYDSSTGNGGRPGFDSTGMYPQRNQGGYYNNYIWYDLGTTLSNASSITIEDMLYIYSIPASSDGELSKLSSSSVWSQASLGYAFGPSLSLGAVAENESSPNSKLDLTVSPDNSLVVTSDKYTWIDTNLSTGNYITVNITIDLVDTKKATISYGGQSSYVSLTSTMISAIKNLQYFMLLTQGRARHSYLSLTVQ